MLINIDTNAAVTQPGFLNFTDLSLSNMHGNSSISKPNYSQNQRMTSVTPSGIFLGNDLIIRENNSTALLNPSNTSHRTTKMDAINMRWT